MLMLASPRREAARANSPGRCGSLTCTTSASLVVKPWLSRTDLVIVGLSATRRTWLSPAPAGYDWKPRMFTPRSASARQVFPRVPGWSNIVMVNSLDVGMVGTSFASIPGTQGASRETDKIRFRLIGVDIIRPGSCGFQEWPAKTKDALPRTG